MAASDDALEILSHRFQATRLTSRVEVTVSTPHELLQYEDDIRNEPILAFDCEGVDLGRHGELSIVQIATPSTSFLFDVLNIKKSSPLVVFLKVILENDSITKIIHDCRMDADALLHILSIRVSQCHDTQAWDSVLRYPYGLKENLNKTLIAYGCNTNSARDSNIYKDNNRFWATRPLSQKMKDHAFGDVHFLFELRDAQESKASKAEKTRCQERSSLNIDLVRSKVSMQTKIHPSKIGRFIGRNGSNIRDLEQNGRFHMNTTGPHGSGEIVVYADDSSEMDCAMRMMLRYK